MEEDKCVLCNSSLLEGEVVTVQRGLSSLIEASKARNDDIHLLLSLTTQITVHVNCRKKYTAKQNIKANINISFHSSENLKWNQKLNENLVHAHYEVMSFRSISKPIVYFLQNKQGHQTQSYQGTDDAWFIK